MKARGGFFWNYNGENCGQQGIIGAFGLNNTGLLVRTWGRIVERDPTWSYVGVTGISSCEKDGTELHSVLRVRTQSDIVPYTSP